MEKTMRAQLNLIITLLFLAGLFSADAAPIPSPEKILPNDTLFLLTIPDFTKARQVYTNSPQVQFWNDPSMKAFREKFMEKFKSEFIKPLERELNIQFSDYTGLPQGQLTFAVVQNGWQGKSEQPPALLLLLDTKSKSEQLKKNLADLKKKWVDAGKTMRTEKIRGLEFSVVPLSGDELPKLLKKSPVAPVEEERNPDKESKKPKHEIFIGQMDSLLIVSDSANVTEKVLSRLTGGSVPTLGELAAYETSHNTLFRDAPVYGWLNTKTLTDVFTKASGDQNESAGGFMDLRPEKIIAATGLSALKTLAFSFSDSIEGSMLNVFLNAPEATRQGILKIIAGEAKETTAPPFVPADAVKYQRWRLNGQKAWATLEKMFNEINPQIMGGINLLLDTASASAKEKDPDFDLKKNLVGNLGDDIITYEKSSRGNTAAGLDAPPSISLIASPHPEQFAAALKGIFVFFPNSQGATPKEREFLGRKIFTLPLPSLPIGNAKPAESRSLHYAASGGYVALSTDVSMLEEFLRSGENPPKGLREMAGLTTAAQKVTGAGTSWFGFENQTETVRVALEVLKKDPTILNFHRFSPVPGLTPANDENKIKEWVDVSLLPSFDKVSKYFHFTVYALSANVEGLSLKFFAPTPPQLKKATEAPAK